MNRSFFAWAIVWTLATLAWSSAGKAEQCLVCGWDEVFILDLAQAEKGKIEKLWSWRGGDRKELPESLRGGFRTTDDCKPVEGGKKILISSSGGGCALVERPSGRVLWYAWAPNAHSLELLPNQRVIVASSLHPNGNRLILYDLARSDQALWDAPLHSAHGVVWDADRQVLWALGYKELRCYELKDWTSPRPSLALKASYPLPDPDGHDLQAVADSQDLVLTTGQHVYLFDRGELKFRLHPELGQKAIVKCVSVHPISGRIAFVQAGEKEWWSDTIGLLSPAAQVKLPGERIYKVRWLVDQPGDERGLRNTAR